MKFHQLLLFIFCFYIIFSCSKNNISDNNYNNSDLKWSMKIPQNWQQIPNQIQKLNRKKGNELLSKEDAGFYKIDDYNSALNIRKDKFNSFNSAYFKRSEFSFKKLEQEIKRDKINKYTIANKYFKTDSTKTEVIQIDGIKFLKYELKSDDLSNIAIIGIIENYELGVGIKCNNNGRKQILDNFLNSKFK